MKHMTIKIVLLLLLFVLVGGAIFYIMRSPGERESASYIPGFSIRDENQEKKEPTPVSNTPVVTVPPTMVPTPVPEPTAPPEPTPTPYVPTPEPVKTPLGSGSISSDRALLLNIHADWSAFTFGNGVALVEVIAYADHYALSYGSVPLVLKLGDVQQQMEANEIRTTINQQQASEIGRHSFSVPYTMGETLTLPLSVLWEFVGTYVDYGHNPVEIYSISCEGDVVLSPS